MYPMFNVQRPSVSGLVLTANLGGAQSAFHVPGPASGTNSPPLAAVAIDTATPFLQTSALLSTLQAAQVHVVAAAAHQHQQQQSQAQGHPSTSSNASSPFSSPSSPSTSGNNANCIILPLASPRGLHQQLLQQLSPAGNSKNGASGGNNSSSNAADAVSPGLCSICSDRATGKHYGANSCDGCKGFFRRTIRKNQTYVCRFNRTCVIDKDKRNTCRYCRFKKCVQAGMRREAVQNERDRISFKRTKSESPPNNLASSTSTTRVTTTETISLLLQAEGVASQLRASVITSTSVGSNNNASAPSPSMVTESQQPRLATIGDLSDAIKQQLLLLVEWAKVLSPFSDLPLDDQVALLRAYAAQHLLLGVARRSLPYRDVLLLSNDACIPRSHSSELHDVNHVVMRLLDELVEPMRDIQLDDTEYVCVKALLFFNPNSYGLTTKQKVAETRQLVLEALQAYVNQKPLQKDKVRFGNILLLLPPLQAMSQQFIEDLQLATLFGMARFDKLLEELLLAAAEPLSAPFLVDGISAVANKVAGVMGIANGMDMDGDEHHSHERHYDAQSNYVGMDSVCAMTIKTDQDSISMTAGENGVSLPSGSRY